MMDKLFMECPIKVITVIGKYPNGICPARLAIESEVTYSYLSLVIERMFQEKLLNKDNLNGRSRLVSLTEKGQEVNNYFQEIKIILKNKGDKKK